MKKKFDIFGRKVPVLAVLIALLVIGTASAALIVNYATLSGEIAVTNSVSVTDSDGIKLVIGGNGALNFSSPATFSIHNTDNEIVTVYLTSSMLTLNESNGVVNNDGLSVAFSGTNVTTVDEITSVAVPAADGSDGIEIVTVTLNQEPHVIPGSCTVTVQVNPTTP